MKLYLCISYFVYIFIRMNAYGKEIRADNNFSSLFQDCQWKRTPSVAWYTSETHLSALMEEDALL